MQHWQTFEVVYRTGPIRLTLHGIQHVGGCYVWKLDDHHDGNVRVGDVVQAINNKKVNTLPLPEICKMIRETPLPLTIKFQRAGHSFDDLINDARLTPFYLEFLQSNLVNNEVNQAEDAQHSVYETQVRAFIDLVLNKHGSMTRAADALLL